MTDQPETTARRTRFETLFADDPDPWGFRTSPYEAAKYAATLAALEGRQFGKALEVGCANGVMTRKLARFCQTLLSLDIADSALALAREEVARDPETAARVTFQRAEIPMDWPEGKFDLILISEVLYFLNPSEIGELARRIIGALNPGGMVLTVNWTGITEQPLDGPRAAACLSQSLADQGLSPPWVSSSDKWQMLKWTVE